MQFDQNLKMGMEIPNKSCKVKVWQKKKKQSENFEKYEYEE